MANKSEKQTETIHNVTIIKLSGPRDNMCRTVYVHLQEPPTRYEISNRTCIIEQLILRKMAVPTDVYGKDVYFRLAKTALRYRKQLVDLDVVGNTIIDIRKSATVTRRHMAAFCIQLYWRRARLNPMLSLAHKIQAARI